MQMRPAVQIQSAIKALTDVVLPAVDPNNKLAQEQARLVVGLLGLMARQLPLQFRFDCDELQRLIEFSDALAHEARGGARTAAALSALAVQNAEARQTLDRARARPEEIEQGVRALRSATGAVVTQVFAEGDAGARRSVQGAVLSMSREQLLRDRAWLRSQGWEPDPAVVPDIESLLAP